MKRYLVLVVAIFVSTLLGCMPAFSQFVFVKVTDDNNNVLVGSSTAVGFANQTVIESYGQGSSACGLAGGQAGCIPTTENFKYNFLLDPTVTDYRRALYLRRVWRKVEFSFTKMNGTTGTLFTYAKVLLEDVYVVGLNEGVSNVEIPTFQVSLDPSKITWTFIPQLSNGSTGLPRSFGYNRVTNTSF